MNTNIMPTKLLKAGETVFKQGDTPDGMYYICYGKVKVSREQEGQTQSLGELGEGDVFGEMALINTAPRNATVTATEDCGFYVMNAQNFQHQVNQLDPVMRGVFRVFVVTIRGFLEEKALRQEIQEEQPRQLGDDLGPEYQLKPIKRLT